MKKMKIANKKTIFVFLILLFIPIVYADTMLVIRFDLDKQSVEYVNAIEDNAYYTEVFETSPNRDFLEQNDLVIQLLSRGVILEQEIDSRNLGFVLADLNDIKNTEKIRVIKGGKTIIENPIDFCNNNNVCEPCNNKSCLVSENVLVCGDCPYNSADNFCDLKKDGICDPDCVAQYDCDDCKTTCLYEEFETCSSKGGMICDETQTCTGEFISADDSGLYCCTGECKSQSAPLTTPKKEISASEEDITFYIIYIAIIFILIIAAGIILIYVGKKQKYQLEQIHNSIALLRLKGHNNSQISKILKTKGWKESQINKAFKK